MSETDQHVNGTAPATPAAADDAPCEDCATSGEKILALLAGLLGVFVLVMAADMFTGGKISGRMKEAVQQ